MFSLLNMMVAVVPGREMVFLRSPPGTELRESLSRDHCLPTLPEYFFVCFLPSHSQPKGKCQLSELARSCSRSSPLVHTLSHSSLQPHISVRRFCWTPERRAQICSSLTSHHVSPTGSDLARTQAALGVMNHRFIFLGHMWVKLFDVNHALTAPACSRRVIACHSPLAALSPCTVVLLEMSTFFVTNLSRSILLNEDWCLFWLRPHYTVLTSHANPRQKLITYQRKEWHRWSL